MSKSLPINFLQKKETLLRMEQIRMTLFLENNATVVESLCMAISLNQRRHTARTVIQNDFEQETSAKTFFCNKNSVNVEKPANKFFAEERNTVENGAD